MNYTYNIDKILNKNLNEIVNSKGRRIFICIYETLFKINSKMENPFLQYLLYKYNKTDDIDEILTFPFFESKSNNLLKESKDFVNKLIINGEYKGYIIFKNNVYVFFGRENREFNFKKLQSNNKYWWCLIDEICNKKKVVTYDVHLSIVHLFLSNPELIYLYDKNNKKLETPIVAYKGDHIDIINYLAAFGQRRSTRSRFGPFYTLGTFNWAIRWCGWSKNYQKHIFKGKNISDEFGKYYKGGIIRYAIFLGNLEDLYVVINNKKNYFKYLINFWDENNTKTKKEIDDYRKKREKETGKWANHYKSLTIPKIKFKNIDGYFNINTEYIISNNNNKITLSIHEIDINSLKNNWDPFYENYRIL